MPPYVGNVLRDSPAPSVEEMNHGRSVINLRQHVYRGAEYREWILLDEIQDLWHIFRISRI
jgi:hypothetical protein